MIKLQNVHYKNPNKIILTDIDLEIERGKKYLVVGPSGSGKTSLLKIMNNLVSVSNGEIFLDNKLCSLRNRHH